MKVLWRDQNFDVFNVSRRLKAYGVQKKFLAFDPYNRE